MAVQYRVPSGMAAVYSGDSITFGWNATLGQEDIYSWRGLTMHEYGNPNADVNNGQPGGHLQFINSGSGENYYHSIYTPSKAVCNGIYIWFSWGINDIKDTNAAYNVADYKATLYASVDDLVNRLGWAYNDIILCTANWLPVYPVGKEGVVADYNAAVLEVATNRNTIFIDLYAHFSGLSNRASLIDTDNIHPNNAGHRAIADFYESRDFTPVNGFDIPPPTTTTTSTTTLVPPTTTTTTAPPNTLGFKGRNVFVV